MKNTLMLLALALPSLSLAAGQKSFQLPVVPALQLPGPVSNSIPLALPGAPALPVLTPGQIAGIYRLPGAPYNLPEIKLPPPRRGLPGEDDLIAGVAVPVTPKRPLAPAAMALAIPVEELVHDASPERLVVAAHRLFDHALAH